MNDLKFKNLIVVGEFNKLNIDSDEKITFISEIEVQLLQSDLITL